MGIKGTRKVITALFAGLFFLVGTPAFSQEAEDNTFGGWEFFEVYHGFGSSGWFASFYFEHDNYQYKRLDNWYTRTTVGYKLLPWLKADVAYDYIYEPSGVTHKGIFDLTGTLKQGNLSVQLRERYLHNWLQGTDIQGNELRSRLKAQYAIPGSRVKPYLMMEVFTWDKWKKTRHYAGTTITLNDHFEIDAFYMYYVFANKPAEHVLGIGLNMEF